MKPLVISYVVFVAAVCGVLLYLQQHLLALAWLCFAGINAVVLRNLVKAPTYFEKVIMDYLEWSEAPVTRDALFSHFKTESPNLKGHETESVFSSTLSRLLQRGLVQMTDDMIEKKRH